MHKSDDVLAYTQLMFRIRHPNLEECWIEGYLAGQRNWTESQNPYERGSLENEHWEQGWWVAFYGELPQYTFEEGHHRHSSKQEVANEPFVDAEGIKPGWTGKVVRIASAIAATVIAVELLDIAI